MTATTTSISEWEQWQRKIQKCLLACFSFPYPFSLFFLCAFQQLTRTYALLVSLMNFNVCGCVNFFFVNSLFLFSLIPNCLFYSVCLLWGITWTVNTSNKCCAPVCFWVEYAVFVKSLRSATLPPSRCLSPTLYASICYKMQSFCLLHFFSLKSSHRVPSLHFLRYWFQQSLPDEWMIINLLFNSTWVKYCTKLTSECRYFSTN